MPVRDEIPDFIRPPAPMAAQADAPRKPRASSPRSRFRLLKRFWSCPQTSELPHAAQAAWLYLWTLADGKGTCYPSQSRIARRIGTSSEHARRMVRALRLQGFVKVLSVGSNRGRNRANVYAVTVPGGAA